MAMQFNPHTAFLRGMDLGSPTTSQGGINNLMQMQQNTMNDALNAFGNIGKTSRTNTVNDLIARGGLSGLNEAQAQAEILKQAGGTLTPEGQAGIDKLLQTTGKQDQRNFTTSERLGGEEFTGNQDRTKASALLSADNTKATAKLLSEKTKFEEDRNSAKLMADAKYDAELRGYKFDEKKYKDEIKSREKVAYQGDFKAVDNGLGKLIGYNPSTGETRELTNMEIKEAKGSGVGGKGTDPLKITGRALKFHDELTGKGKDSFEQIYSTGDLQVSPASIIRMKDGTSKEEGYKVMYKGKPITITELKQMVERKK